MAPPLIVVRAATPADAADIARICGRAARVAYAGLVSPDYLERLLAHFFGEERLRGEVGAAGGWFGFEVAERDGAVVGIAGTGRSAHQGDACELFALYVDPDAHRRGVGRALVASALAQARAAEARQLHVAVLPGNLPAIRFYEACGFCAAGTREIYAPHGEEGGPDQALLFARDIAPSAG